MNDILKNDCSIPDYANVTITKTNDIVEVQYLEKRNNFNNIKRLDDKRYLVISTGEIKEFNKNEKRLDNHNSFRQTFKKLRYLINNNFVGAKNELFLTLTYAENMTDHKRLYFDLDKFLKRLRYKYIKKSNIEYITVIEPQKRGAWHAHILLKFTDLKEIYIPNSVIAEIWGLGFVNVQSIAKMSIDNIGAYLTAYLTDLPLESASDLRKYDELKEVDGKYYIKGSRLRLYPKGINFYRKSKGIIYPERITVPFSEIKKYVGNAVPTYSKKFNIKIDDFDNTIIFYHYNLKRKKGK